MSNIRTPEFLVGGILSNSLVNGEGMRYVIFFSGCKHDCKGCQNPHLQIQGSGRPVTVNKLVNQIEKEMPIIDGVTLSGGEPFDQDWELLDDFIKELRHRDINIWCYTGYKIEELYSKANKTNRQELLDSIISNLDIVVDGKYIEELNDNEDENSYRGSTNQRVLNRQDILDIRDTGSIK